MTQDIASPCVSCFPPDPRREAALSGLAILDTLPEREFDTVVKLAQQSLHCNIALISLVDTDRQWFKAKVGLNAAQTPIEQSFCAHAVKNDDTLIVPDAAEDPRFANNPLVTGAPFIRFYAGIPIRALVPGTSEMVAIGTLCVIDEKPRMPAAGDIKILQHLAYLVEALIQARTAAARVAALAEEQRNIVARLDRRQIQLLQAERMSNMGSWRLNLLDRSTEWSDQVFAVYGLPAGKPPAIKQALSFFPLHARCMVMAAVKRTIRTGQPFDFESDFLAANGVLKRVRNMGEAEIANGITVAVIGVIQDITAQHKMEQELRRNASIDELTQLGNRAGCNRAIEDRIAEARKRNDPLALMLIDLDGFKQVNDIYGHLAGDELLRLIGTRLKAPYLANCFAGRLGGDEFIIIVSALDDCAAFEQITRLLLLDLRQPVACSGGNLHVSGTIGVAWLDHSVRDRSELLRRADLALYEAKRDSPGSAKTFGRHELITVEAGDARSRLKVVA